MLDKLITTVSSIRAGVIYSRSAYSVQLCDLPDDLYTYWRASAALEFKGIPRDAFFFVRAAEGLMEFFDCVSRSGQACALPSKAADSVWHAWSRLAPSHLERFCIRHFAQPIAHVEAIDMHEPMGTALGACLVMARRIEGRAPAASNVPRLFSLDRRLRMPFGFAYTSDAGRLAFRDMDGHGCPEGYLSFPLALHAPQLFAAKLVTRAEYVPYAPVRAQPGRNNDGGGVSCASASSRCADSDSGGDGGDGGGGGGGGSCGGGGD